MKFKKTAAAVLALSFVLPFSGCANHDEEYTEEMKTITEDYLTALEKDDDRTIEDITDDYDYGEDAPMSTRYDHNEVYTVMKAAISKTEIVEWGEAEFNDEKTEAEMDCTFSYIDLEEFRDGFDTQYITLYEYADALNAFEDRSEETITLKFVFDEDDETWLLTAKSADKILGLFDLAFNVLPDPVDVSPSDAQDLIITTMELMAEGNFDGLPFEFSADELRAYENMEPKADTDAVSEYAEDFAAAYIGYVLDHDYEITEISPYDFILTGSAPSSEDLYQALISDEFVTANLANDSLYIFFDKIPLDVMLEKKSYIIYENLTNAVPGCSPEEYSLEFTVTPYLDTEYPVFLYDLLINPPAEAYYQAEHSIAEEQYMRCINDAMDQLLADGEITSSEYDDILPLLTPEFLGFTTDGSVSPEGHPNQAVGTAEQVPEWCTDGSIVYGYSNPDSNGVWMHYSKEPGVLDTVGYYLDDTGIWVTLTYEDDYPLGSDLTIDLDVDGERVIDNKPFASEDGQKEFEIFFAWNGTPYTGTYELRLWENDHNHVLAYVTIYA
ncbi:MAG: hypothetical protein J5883_01025 [Clostridiales bacterium]|nr:hypothetical protein [Clostridiales bacterium]